MSDASPNSLISTDCSIGSRAAQWIFWSLRLIVVLQLIGAAGELRATETSLFKLIVSHPDEGALGLSEEAASLASFSMMTLLLSIAALTLVWPLRFALVIASAWFFFQAALETYLKQLGGEPFALVPVPAEAARMAAPLALFLLLPLRANGDPVPIRWRIWELLLRVGICLTFAAHGYEAWARNQTFIDYLIVFSHYFPGGHLEQVSAEKLLRVIGVIDVILAGLVLLVRWRFVAFYMAFWGVVTALSRVVCEGLDPLYAASLFSAVYSGCENAWFKTLIRAANGGLPGVLFLYWTYLPSLTRNPTAESPSSNEPPFSKG